MANTQVKQSETIVLRDVAHQGLKTLKQWTLFLTAAENAIWEEMYLRATDIVGERRIGVSSKGFSLEGAAHVQDLKFTSEDLAEATSRFVLMGILEYVGEGKQGIGKDVYRFVRNPDQFTVVLIDQRKTVGTQLAYLNLIRKVQGGEFPVQHASNFYRDFRVWLLEQNLPVHPDSVWFKLCKMPKEGTSCSAAWGIIIRGDHDGTPFLRTCWPGFEPYVFEILPGDPPRVFKKPIVSVNVPKVKEMESLAASLHAHTAFTDQQLVDVALQIVEKRKVLQGELDAIVVQKLSGERLTLDKEEKELSDLLAQIRERKRDIANRIENLKT